METDANSININEVSGLNNVENSTAQIQSDNCNLNVSNNIIPLLSSGSSSDATQNIDEFSSNTGDFITKSEEIQISDGNTKSNNDDYETFQNITAQSNGDNCNLNASNSSNNKLHLLSSPSFNATQKIDQFSSSTGDLIENSTDIQISEFSSDIIEKTLSDIINQVTSSHDLSLSTNFTETAPMIVDSDVDSSEKENIKAIYTPKQIAQTGHFPSQHYTKGCKWSPDGQCLIVNTAEDNKITFFNTPLNVHKREYDSEVIETLDECLDIKEAEIIYDYCWYPLLDSRNPATCCLATTAKDQPLHLWDAFDGSLRASYIAYNHVHEVHSANSICFSPNGEQILCGFKKELVLFFTDRPGSESEIWSTRKKDRRCNQNGIISCIDFAPDGNLFACGCYDKSVAIYSAKNGHASEFITGHVGGVTSVQFSMDGNRLYTGARKDNVLNCWDMRFLTRPLLCMERNVATNQRIYFDLFYRNKSTHENLLASGTTDGYLSMWDLESIHSTDFPESINLQPVISYKAHNDCVNGCSINPYFPIIATSSGQRTFSDIYYDSDGDDTIHQIEQNIVNLWYVPFLDSQNQIA